MQFQEQTPLPRSTTFHIGGPARYFAEATSEEEILEAVHFARARELPLFVLGGGSNLLVADEGFPGLVVPLGPAPPPALTPFRFEDLSPQACGFAYRRSIFNGTARGRYLVTQVDYALIKDGTPRIAYADLKMHFARAAAPSLSEVSAAVRSIRHQKGMLIVPGDPDCRSAGSFFKNPVIAAAHYARIVAQQNAEVPHYPAPSGEVKVRAAWLLDPAGFHKGYTLGAAGISSPPPRPLTNRGAAKAADILALRDRIIA